MHEYLTQFKNLQDFYQVFLSDFLAQNVLIPLDQNESKGAKCPRDLRINASVKKEWDLRVKIAFQPKAWCDENIMKSQVIEDWDNHFLNPATPGFTGKILFADIQRAQQTSSVKRLLHKNKIFLLEVLEVEYNHSTWLLTNHLKIMFENYSKNIMMKAFKLVQKEHYLLQKDESYQLSESLKLGKN